MKAVSSGLCRIAASLRCALKGCVNPWWQHEPLGAAGRSASFGLDSAGLAGLQPQARSLLLARSRCVLEHQPAPVQGDCCGAECASVL